MQDPEGNEAQRVVWVELDRLGRVGDRAVKIALVAAGNAAVEVGRRNVRIDVEGLAGVGDRLVVILLAAIGGAACHIRGAACHIRGGRVRIDLDRLVLVGNRFVEIALSPTGRSARWRRGRARTGRSSRSGVCRRGWQDGRRQPRCTTASPDCSGPVRHKAETLATTQPKTIS
jgi:hypothetical protein